MPRSGVTIACDFTSDATWRTMLSAIKTNIEAMGWVQTSDTGQIDFATTLKPTASNQVRGYALWRANDALSATKPMILRLQFGSAGSSTQLRIRPQFGHITDGAGTFTATSNSWDRGDLDGPGSSATAYECYFCGDTNRIAFKLFDNHPSTNNQYSIGIERSHDSTGADTDVGFYCATQQGGTNSQNRFIPYVGTNGIVQSNFIGPRPTSATLIGLSVGLMPIFPIYVVALNQSVSWVGYFGSDIGANTIITFDMYGATRTFLTLRSSLGPGDANGLAMRYEV